MGSRRTTTMRVLTLVVLSLALTGCVRGCRSSRPPIHLNPNMDDQPRYDSQTASDFFYDGMTMREPVPGTVARGELTGDAAWLTGKDAAGEFLSEIPLEPTEALLERGRDRYAIYCLPCHDKVGRGKGVLFEYGGVPTPSFHDDQRRDYPVGRLYDVITNGSGLMPAYRYPITPADRWAIVSHVRRLQEQEQAAEIAQVTGR